MVIGSNMKAEERLVVDRVKCVEVDLRRPDASAGFWRAFLFFRGDRRGLPLWLEARRNKVRKLANDGVSLVRLFAFF